MRELDLGPHPGCCEDLTIREALLGLVEDKLRESFDTVDRIKIMILPTSLRGSSLANTRKGALSLLLLSRVSPAKLPRLQVLLRKFALKSQ